MLPTKPPTILLVDDTEANRYAAGRILKQAGFVVIEVANGKAAMDAVAALPDLVVLDVSLPDIDGFEVCRRFKADPATANIPVLQISASFISVSDQVQGLEGGADGYLVQPFEAPVLVATIRALLRMRRAEEQARLLSAQWQATFGAISDPVWLLDNDGGITRCNPAMSRLFGLPAADMTGRAAADFVPEHSSLKTNSEIDIEGHWYNITSDIICNEQGKPMGTVQIWGDVTYRRQLLQGEQAARAEAERANLIKDEFLATLSHELRSPLTAVLGWLHLLLTGEMGPEETTQALETIDRNARAQMQIISDLLEISRAVTGKLYLELLPVDIVPIVHAAIESVRPIADAKNLKLNLHMGSPPFIVSLDAGRFQQVMWNLLSNAIKFTPRSGSVTISVAQQGSFIAIQITDTGVGIDGDFLPHAFDRFRQGDSTTTRRHGGLGLGLSIARHLTELHGGTIAVESAGLNLGSTFTIKLPVSTRSIAQGGDKLEMPELPSRTTLAGLRVQVVDDLAESREIVAAILLSYGAEVRTNSSAIEALGTLRQWRPDALVSDIGMPGVDGFDLIKWVRNLGTEEGGNTPALALTAYTRDQDQIQALEAGYHAFLAKPVEPQTLVGSVATIIGKHQPKSVQ